MTDTVQREATAPSLRGAFGLLLAAALVHAFNYTRAAAFAELFRGFGGGLPTLTALTVSMYPYAWLTMGLGVVPFIMLLDSRGQPRDRDRLLFRLIIANLVLAFLMTFVMIVAAYLPIWKMGTVIE